MSNNDLNIIGDKPIQLPDEEIFQRLPFAKKIAETLVSRNSKDPFVLGIYGAWGEGKTSVLNLIQNNVGRSSGNNIIQIVYNPWRFTNQESMVSSFLRTLARELKKEDESQIVKQKKFKKRLFLFNQKKDPLKTTFENLSGLLYDYAGSLEYGGIGNVIKSVSNKISDVDLEEIKNRFENLLIEKKKKLIIYIDDIDRLDKSEIQAIFKLVKLTADFSYCTYVLSFDEKMVAAAIGEQFGKGDEVAGTNFLEKIIQLPLHIPKVQPTALKNFLFKKIEKITLDNLIQISEYEIQRFSYQFSTNVLLRLNTPRSAIRYSNLLSFSIPLLYNEINVVDLMLIEAVKIFYPNHYSHIKNNPEYYIGSYTNNSGSNNLHDEKIHEITSILNKLEEDLDYTEKGRIRNLLKELFPQLSIAIDKKLRYNNNDYQEWYINKRISSIKYFERYFTYTVISGDISDISFSILIDKLNNNSIVDNVEYIEDMLELSSSENFIFKLRSKISLFNWVSTQNIIKSLFEVSDKISDKGGILNMTHETPKGQSIIFIEELMIINKSEPELFNFVHQLFIDAKSFHYAFDLYNRLIKNDTLLKINFNDEQKIILENLLTDRAISISGDSSIFVIFPEYVYFISNNWYLRNIEEYLSYSNNYMNKNVENVLNILKSHLPSFWSSARPGVRLFGNLTKEIFDLIAKYYTIDNILNRVLNIYSIDLLTSVPPYEIDINVDEYTDLNLCRQFYKLYTEINYLN